MTLRRRLAVLLGLPVAAALAWGAGFGWFLHAAWMTADPPSQADGIVALTGGAERVETALKLLAEGHARVLLISGVGGAADFAAFAHRAGVNSALQARVTLGRNAVSTRGNAAETADWAQANGLGSLIVVTAGYHMPRALAELSRAMPTVTLYPVPVLPPAMRQPGVNALRLLAGEYTKWLVTEAGLSALVSRGETHAASLREDRAAPLREDRAAHQAAPPHDERTSG
jgi:uncharacterized SAM-binding protein YcdF (DUF218 family)